MKKLIISVLITVAIFTWFGDYFVQLLSDPKPAPPECRPISVMNGDISLKISGRGVVQPKRIVNVIPRQFGEIRKVMVVEGDTVKKGQLLIQIKPGSNTRLNLQEIKEKLHNATIHVNLEKKNFEEKKQLLSEGLVSKSAVETAEKTYKATVRGLNEIRTRAKIFEKETGIKIDDTTGGDPDILSPIFFYISAPISGTVMSLNAKPGDVIAPDPAMQQYNPPVIIADITQFLVEYKASELDIGKIKIGQEAKIQFDSFPETMFNATITKVSGIAKSSSIGMPEFMGQNNIVFFGVTLLLDPSDIRPKIGMSGRVNIIYDKKKNVRLVPVEAVFKENEKEFCYMMEGESFFRREVVTGVSDENFVEIISELPDDTLLCNHPLRVLEWEELCRIYDKRSIIEKILN